MARRSAVEWRGQRVPHLYARATTSGLTRFEAYRKVNGRPLRRVLDATSTSEAVRLLPAALAAIDREARTGSAPRRTFGEWADEHVAALQEKVARGELNGPGHVENTRARLRHLEPLHDRPIAELTVADVEQVVARLTRARRVVGGKPRPYGAATIRSVVACGHAVCRRAERAGAVERNVFALLDRSDLPRLQDGARARLGLADLWLLVEHAAAHRRPMVAALALTGARVGEVAGLRWSDVDFASQRITIDRQMRRDGHAGRLKTQASRRVIDLDVRLASELRRHRREALELGRAAPDDLVFQRPEGGPVSQRHAHRWVQAAAKRAGLPAVRVHDLRHSFGSVLVSAGVPITTVARHLGHANPATTMRLYARELDETQRLGLVREVLSRGGGSHQVATDNEAHAQTV